MGRGGITVGAGRWGQGRLEEVVYRYALLNPSVQLLLSSGELTTQVDLDLGEFKINMLALETPSLIFKNEWPSHKKFYFRLYQLDMLNLINNINHTHLFCHLVLHVFLDPPQHERLEDEVQTRQLVLVHDRLLLRVALNISRKPLVEFLV